MIEALVGFALLLLIPLIALKLLFGLIFWVVMLPFKVLGALLKVFFGIVGLGAKLAFSAVGLVMAIAAVVVVVVVLPLLPLLLLGAGLWLLIRAMRRPAPAAPALHRAYP